MKERRKISQVEEYQITYTNISPSRGWCAGSHGFGGLWIVTSLQKAQVEGRKEVSFWCRHPTVTTSARGPWSASRAKAGDSTWPGHTCVMRKTLTLSGPSRQSPVHPFEKHQTNPNWGPPHRTPDSKLSRSRPRKPENLRDPGEPKEASGLRVPWGSTGREGTLGENWGDRNNAWTSVNTVISQYWFIHCSTGTL